MSPQRTDADLGDLGQKTVEFWAAQARIIATRPEKDMNGWDYYLELPTVDSKATNIPLDKSPTQLSCFVQVKATDKFHAAIDVSLSNWKKMVEQKLPTFFLILEFHGREDCQAAYLVHVDVTFIKKILKQLREISTQRTTKPLHKRTVKLKYNESHAMTLLSGQGLRRELENHIGDVGEYVKRKIVQLETVGYEEGNRLLKFDVRLPEEYREKSVEEYLVDLSLGLTRDMVVVSGEIKDYRFGLEGPTSIGSLDQSIINFDNESLGVSTARFYTPDLQEEVQLAMETRLPRGLSEIMPFTDPAVKVLYSVPFIKLIASFNKKNTQLTISLPNGNEIHSLEDLKRLTDFSLFCLDAVERDVAILGDINFLDKPTFKLDPTRLEEVFPAPVYETMDTVQHAWVVLKAFDLQYKTELRLADLSEWKWPLNYMHQLLTANQTPGGRVEFRYDGDVSQRRVFLPHIFCAQLGKYVVRFATALFGDAVSEQGPKGGEPRLAAYVDEAFVEFKGVHEVGEVPLRSDRQLLEHVIEKHTPNSFITLLPQDLM